MNAPIMPMPAWRSERWQDEIPAKLDTALTALGLDKTEAYADLVALAEKVEIDGYSLDIESAVIKGEEWIAPGTIFVLLSYEINSEEPVELYDSYPIEVNFHLKNGDVIIDSVTADTSSFYE